MKPKAMLDGERLNSIRQDGGDIFNVILIRGRHWVLFCCETTLFMDFLESVTLTGADTDILVQRGLADVLEKTFNVYFLFMFLCLIC